MQACLQQLHTATPFPFSKQLPFWIHAHNFLPCLSELFTVRNYIKRKKFRKLLYFLISVLVKLNIVFIVLIYFCKF